MLLIASLIVCFINSANATDLVQQFKSPSFSGAGYSSHVLTIDSIEKSRRDTVAAEKKAASDAVISASANTPLNRFMSLFQSQVYAQLATQLSNNLFQNKCTAADGGTIPGCANPNSGNFALDGNTVTWTKTINNVTLTVVDSNGSITTVTVPIASFSF